MTENPKKTVQFGSGISPQERSTGTRILTNGEITKAFQFRHKVIVEQLGWCPGNGSGLETDDYDQWSTHFGTVGEEGLIAYARALHSTDPEKYMLFNEFRKILGEEKAKKILSEVDEEISCEISRLISSSGITSGERQVAVFQLYARMCRWGIAENKTKWYIVVDERLAIKFGELGFVFEVLSRGEFFPGNGVCVAACLDLRASLESVKRNPGLYEAIFQGVDQI